MAEILKRQGSWQILMRPLLDLFRLNLRFLLGKFAEGLGWDLNILG